MKNIRKNILLKIINQPFYENSLPTSL